MLKVIFELEIGRATVFEVILALRSADALEELRGSRYRLAKRTPLGRALRRLVAALESAGDDAVDRPPRPRAARVRATSLTTGTICPIDESRGGALRALPGQSR